MDEVRTLASIDAVDAAAWNALQGAACPFLRHEFLAALEHTGCVGGSTGWEPAHMALFEGARLVAAAPAYRKQHSWGEFVFDFGWAEAHQRHGLPYYPKLLCAVPFSPVGGARLLAAPGERAAARRGALVDALQARCMQEGLSSAHALFIDADEREMFAARGWLLRSDVQFHWHNAGYADFGQYLETFRADKRKQVRRERRRCAEAGIRFRTLRGSAVAPEVLRFAHAVHARTFRQHGHSPYLSLECFEALAAGLGDALVVILAEHGTTPVAAAVLLASADTLYGRYWGAVGEFHSLHFETCYHQGIEFCIEHGLARFEPGTQGEHKLARGFAPVRTWSAHHIADARFRRAIGDYLAREQQSVDDYAALTAAHVPFHRA